MKFFILIFILTIFLKCESSCVDRIFNLNNVFITSSKSKRSPTLLQQIICTNISADLIIDYEYKEHSYSQELEIRNSVIPKLPTNSSLSKFINIKTLRIIGVQIEDIEPGAFDSFVNLKKLNLNANKLKKISKNVFNNLKNLDSLYLANNEISTIEDNAFIGLIKLTHLHLQENKISKLKEGVFSDLKNLKSLWISGNPLIEFAPSDFPNLGELIAVGTKLKQLNLNFQKSHIKNLQFTNSTVEEIDFDKITATDVIDFASNQITTVQNWIKLKCERVLLNHNQIISFDISEYVIHLILSHNKIETIGNSVNNKKQLIELDLAFNKITKITSDLLKGLNDLEILNLNYNQITDLKERIFINNPKLRKLSLANNKIGVIKVEAFIGLDNLDELDISRNRLTKIESPVLSEVKKGIVVINNIEMDWNYVKNLINNSTDLALGIDEQVWNCQIQDNSEQNVNKLKYISKSNVNSLKCNFKKM